MTFGLGIERRGISDCSQVSALHISKKSYEEKEQVCRVGLEVWREDKFAFECVKFEMLGENSD